MAADADTTLLAGFEGTASPKPGPPTRATGLRYEQGVVGRGGGAGRCALRYPAAKVLDARAGTVKLWLRPRWDGNSGRSRLLFQAGAAFDNGLLIQVDGQQPAADDVGRRPGHGGGGATSSAAWARRWPAGGLATGTTSPRRRGPTAGAASPCTSTAGWLTRQTREFCSPAKGVVSPERRRCPGRDGIGGRGGRRAADLSPRAAPPTRCARPPPSAGR
ncbi:MAG: hypothetical protein U0736_02415 [Gemmataceae bacterium]